MNKPTKKYIGIDPSFRENGFCICVLDAEQITFFTFKNFIDFIHYYNANDFLDTIFCVENSNLQDTTFSKCKIPSELAKISRSVGKNQAVSQIVVWMLQAKVGKERVLNISPKFKGANLTPLQFEQASSLKIKTSQDERDAYKLACIAKRLYK